MSEPAEGAGAPGAKGGMTFRGLGCLIIAGVAVAAVVAVALERPSGPPPGQAKAAEAARAGRADEAEADDAVKALRTYYDAGQAVAAADWRWAKCHDETKGFDAVLACAKSVNDEISSIRARAPMRPMAGSTCGHEIEDAHRAYIDGQDRFHGDVVDWLLANRAALSGPLRRAALPAVCGAASNPCDGRPVDTSQKYGSTHGASYARVMAVECTKRLFSCGAADNVCFINKAASRLGLGTEASTTRDLAVRSTGRAIR